MTFAGFCPVVRASLLALLPFSLFSAAQVQDTRKTAVADADHVRERAEWFLRGRVIPGKSSAELRYRAYQSKLQARAARLARTAALHAKLNLLRHLARGHPLGQCRWRPMPQAADFRTT